MIVQRALSTAVSSAVRSIVDAPAAGIGGFNPDDLFLPGNVGGVLTVSMATCYQDAAGAVPVTAVGQWVNSIRATDGTLWDWSGYTDAATYEIDTDGYAHLRSVTGPPSGGWGLAPVGLAPGDWREMSVVVTANGLLANEAGAIAAVGFFTSDGGSPDASGYEMVTSPNVDYAGNTQVFWTDISTYTPVSDVRTTITSGRVRAAGSTLRINAEPDATSPTGYNPLPGPNPIVGVLVSYDSSFYGAVVINRYIDDAELAATIVWSEGLADVDMSPFAPPAPPVFHPLDLFLPGDVGGFYDSRDMSTLFQARTGPTNPVTANNQPVGYIVDLNGQFDLARPIVNQPYTFRDGGLIGVASNTLTTSLVSQNLSGFTEMTFAQSGYVDVVAMRTGDNQLINSFGPFDITLADGAQLFIQIGVTTNRLHVQNQPNGAIAAIANIPNAEFSAPYVCGAVLDFVNPGQFAFLNDLEVTTGSSVQAPSAGFRIGTSVWASGSVAQYWQGISFFINRKLSTTELAQLKAWMRANTPTP